MLTVRFILKSTVASHRRMEEPNPQRHVDGTFGELSKVFIVYPHNPQIYTWNPVEQQRKEEAARREEVIKQHNQLVHHFAQFLQSMKIAVAYEGMLTDAFTSNYMKWFQTQILSSDYVILIITESFCPFLMNQPPEDKEKIFTGNFLHTLIHNPKKPLLPVFLNRPRNLDLLPDALRSSTTYTIMSTGYPPWFDVQMREMDSLFALLTRQSRIMPPPVVASVPIVNPFLRRRQGTRFALPSTFLPNQLPIHTACLLAIYAQRGWGYLSLSILLQKLSTDLKFQEVVLWNL